MKGLVFQMMCPPTNTSVIVNSETEAEAAAHATTERQQPLL